jgi:hypothetical protein
VVYEADRFADEQLEVFSVPIEGPAVAGVRLNEPLQPGGVAGDPKITPDSERVVFRQRSVPGGELTVHSVPIEGPGSAGTTLTQSLVPDGGVAQAIIDPTGTRVVYAGFQETSGVLELYSVPVLGPANASVKLNKSLPPGGDVSFGGIDISPNGEYVAYLADQEVDERVELFSVPAIGPASAGVKLNGLATLDVTGFRLSLDSRRILYRRNRLLILPSPPQELYVVPTIGPASASFRVSGPMVLGGDVDDSQYDFTPNGEHVVYIADQDTDEVFELYVSATTAGVRGWEMNE